MSNYIEYPPPILSHDQYGHLCRRGPDGRVYRICGSGRRGLPLDYPCCRSAGTGTNHRGVGYCRNHDKGGRTEVEMPDLLDIALEKIPQDSPLAKSLESTRQISSADLNSQDVFLRLISALTIEHLENCRDPQTGEFKFSEADGNRLLKLARNAREFQETKLKADQLKTFNPVLIPRLLEIIMVGISGLLMRKKVDQTIIDQSQEVIVEAVKQVFADSAIAQLSRDMQADTLMIEAQVIEASN